KSCCFRPDHLLDEVPGLVRARGNITSSSSCQFRRPRVFAPVFVLTAVPARFATTPQPPATAPTATLGRVAWTTLSSFSQLLPLTRESCATPTRSPPCCTVPVPRRARQHPASS